MTLRTSLVAALLVLFGTGCGTAFVPAAAVVGGREISVTQVDEALDAFRRSDGFAESTQGGDRGAVLRGFEQSYLSRQIRVAVFEPEAEALGIGVTDGDVEAQIEEIKSGFENASAFEEALKEQGLTIADLHDLVYESELEARLRAEVTSGIEPTEDEIAAHYEEQRDRFTEVRSSHILVTDNAAAIDIADRLHSAPPGEVDALFASLARRESIDTVSGGDGGDLGYSNYSEFVEPFARALQDLEVGQISDPVRTEFGYHVIYLTDRRVTPLFEVREQIVTELSGAQQDDAWQAWVRERYAAADISVNPRYGELNLDTQELANATGEDVPGAAETVNEPGPAAAPSPAG